jgi:hypothetical protein
VKEIPESPTDDDAFDPVEAKRADALMALVEGASGSDGGRASVSVHVPVESLLSGKGANGLVAGGPPLHPEVVRKLTCDSRVRMVLERDGKPVWVGHDYRIAPPKTREIVEHRDRYRCTFPGCGAKRFTHHHHIVAWPLGPTEPDNLVLICSTHHKLVHEHGWHVSLRADGTADWRRPDWTPYVPGSPPEPRPLEREAFRNGSIARSEDRSKDGDGFF